MFLQNQFKFTLGLAAFSISISTTFAANNVQCTGKGYNPKLDMVWVESGTFVFGSDRHYPEESRQRVVDVEGFWISRHEVTNAEYSEFVDATGYKTLAERLLTEQEFPDVPDSQREPGSAVFVFSRNIDFQPQTQGWQFINGANWRQPQGANSSIIEKPFHPVVHIAYEDAEAYAKWKGHQLPSEIQWEFAARADAETREVEHQQPVEANTWQGRFPVVNMLQDGFSGSAPVGCFKANAQGLYDMIGNVWEWTSSVYFPSHDYHAVKQTKLGNKSLTKGYDPRQPGVKVNAIKGGSFLCAPNFCKRYRSSARQSQDVSLGTSHLGFRTVIVKENEAR